VFSTERETEDGKVEYEVEITHRDCKYELHIKDDGTIEAIEKEINLKDVPEAVLKAVKACVDSAKAMPSLMLAVTARTRNETTNNLRSMEATPSHRLHCCHWMAIYGHLADNFLTRVMVQGLYLVLDLFHPHSRLDSGVGILRRSPIESAE
jgi:hypothetical protein